MVQLLPLPFIEAPASAKLSVLHPCTPRAGDERVSAPGGPACEAKEALLPANVGEGPCPGGWEGGPLSDLASRKRKKRLPVGTAEAAGFSMKGRGRLGARHEGSLTQTATDDMHASAPQQPLNPQRIGAALASGFESSGIMASREVRTSAEGGDYPPTTQGTEEDALTEWSASPVASLKLGVFRCLQDLRAEGEGPPGRGSRSRALGCFSNHVLNVLDACEVEDLEPYLQIFSVCLKRGAPPRCLPAAARGLMLEALEALEASGFSVHVRAVCKQYRRVIRTLRRRDALFPPLTSSSSSNSSSSSSGSMEGGRREVLRMAAAAAGREDAELADLWVNASLDDPEAEKDRWGRPHAEACRGIERSHEYLLHCKHTILRQLRALRRLAPVWAARERAYEYHFEAVMGARSPAELSAYLVIFAGLEADPDGKHVVSMSSILGCLRELRLLQFSNPQEAAAALAPPVTQAELSHCLSASSAKRGLAAGGGAGGVPHGARKMSGRSAAAAAMPAPATRAQKHRVVSPQLEAEVGFNLRRLAADRQGTAVFGCSVFASPASPRDVRLRDTDSSLIYAEELLAVAAGGDPSSSAVAQQAACGELQRLLQYWEEGVFPAVSSAETPATPGTPQSPRETVFSSSVQLKQPPLWRLTRTRSSPPCTVGVAAAAAVAAAAGDSARRGPTAVAAAHPYFRGGPLGGDSDRLVLSRLQQRLSPFGRLSQATQSRGIA